MDNALPGLSLQCAIELYHNHHVEKYDLSEGDVDRLNSIGMDYILAGTPYESSSLIPLHRAAGEAISIFLKELYANLPKGKKPVVAQSTALSFEISRLNLIGYRSDVDLFVKPEALKIIRSTLEALGCRFVGLDPDTFEFITLERNDLQYDDNKSFEGAIFIPYDADQLEAPARNGFETHIVNKHVPFIRNSKGTGLLVGVEFVSSYDDHTVDISRSKEAGEVILQDRNYNAALTLKRLEAATRSEWLKPHLLLLMTHLQTIVDDAGTFSELARELGVTNFTSELLRSLGEYSPIVPEPAQLGLPDVEAHDFKPIIDEMLGALDTYIRTGAI